MLQQEGKLHLGLHCSMLLASACGGQIGCISDNTVNKGGSSFYVDFPLVLDSSIGKKHSHML
jgi:hypothetical protein